MTINDSALSYIRTYVPYGIGLVLGWLFLRTGIDLHGPLEASLGAFLIAGITNIYYLAVRFAEAKYPVLGIFLGAPRAPVYADVSDLWNSLVRTAIPTVVSATVVAIFGNLLHLDAGEQLKFIAIGVGLVSSLYYTAAREIARRWPSWNLLGKEAPAAYIKKH